MNDSDPTCAVCGSPAALNCSLRSSFSNRLFEVAHCPICHYSFVVNPRTDYAHLYNADYYRGEGADPTVDFEAEVSDPRTIRAYEWQGVLTLVDRLHKPFAGSRWLDFGCGLGGLVSYVRDRGIDVVGYDDGYAATFARARGVPLVDGSALGTDTASFDIITAIEVLEHLVDPLTTLRQLSGLLRPGGLLFLTTGNAAPFRGRLETWSYVQPDVHVGYFEPGTLDRALRDVGLQPAYPGFLPGFTGVIRYKVLKRLGIRRRRAIERLVPWPVAARAVDRRYRVTAQPVGWKC